MWTKESLACGNGVHSREHIWLIDRQEHIYEGAESFALIASRHCLASSGFSASHFVEVFWLSQSLLLIVCRSWETRLSRSLSGVTAGIAVVLVAVLGLEWSAEDIWKKRDWVVSMHAMRDDWQWLELHDIKRRSRVSDCTMEWWLCPVVWWIQPTISGGQAKPEMWRYCRRLLHL